MALDEPIEEAPNTDRVALAIPAEFGETNMALTSPRNHARYVPVIVLLLLVLPCILTAHSRAAVEDSSKAAPDVTKLAEVLLQRAVSQAYIGHLSMEYASISYDVKDYRGEADPFWSRKVDLYLGPGGQARLDSKFPHLEHPIVVSTSIDTSWMVFLGGGSATVGPWPIQNEAPVELQTLDSQASEIGFFRKLTVGNGLPAGVQLKVVRADHQDSGELVAKAETPAKEGEAPDVYFMQWKKSQEFGEYVLVRVANMSPAGDISTIVFDDFVRTSTAILPRTIQNHSGCKKGSSLAVVTLSVVAHDEPADSEARLALSAKCEPPTSRGSAEFPWVLAFRDFRSSDSPENQPRQ